MRKFIIWTLTILLGFEPALWAEGSARQQTEIRAFLERTELSRKSVSLRDLYNQNSNLLSTWEKQSLKKFIDTYGDYTLPKMDVSKVKGAGGKEWIQLQAVQNGKSVTMEIADEGEVFARINGKTLTAEDMRSVASLMSKVGVPSKEVKALFDVKRPQGSFLTAEQLKKLNSQDRARYFKQFRQLLESMEAVDQAFAKEIKTSGLTPFSPQWEMALTLLSGEQAWAEAKAGESCVAAGYVAKTALDKSGRLKCGTDGQSGVATEYRGSCSADKFLCNPAVYGDKEICVSGGRDTTKLCNQQVKGSDIPDIAKNAAQFDEMKRDAEAMSEHIAELCAAGGDKKTTAGLAEDQSVTCENFKQRHEEIKSWSCEKPEFKSKYTALCKDASTETAAVASTTVVKNKAVAPIPRCDQLPLNEAVVGTACEGGNVSNKITGSIKCLDGTVEKDVIECNCTKGTMLSRFKCGKTPVAESTDSKSSSGGTFKERKSKRNDGPNWLLIGAMGLGGLLLFNWLAKSAVKQQYRQLQPLPQNPPVPPPTPTVPPPRGVT